MKNKFVEAQSLSEGTEGEFVSNSGEKAMIDHMNITISSIKLTRYMYGIVKSCYVHLVFVELMIFAMVRLSLF